MSNIGGGGGGLKPPPPQPPQLLRPCLVRSGGERDGVQLQQGLIEREGMQVIQQRNKKCR